MTEHMTERRAGVLLPVSALPGEYGIGTLGRGAFEWVDFLARAGQRVWQVLPVGPTAYGDSPYQSPSAFAGNPLFLDPALLRRRGLLTGAEERDARDAAETVQYGALVNRRLTLLRTAAGRMDAAEAGYQSFCAKERVWLEDYALFMSLREAQGNLPVSAWPLPLRRRTSPECGAARYAPGAELWRRLQFLFQEQWMRLKTHANARGVEIFGDLPLYIGADSADLWAEPSLFYVDGALRLTVLAGCPPDDFAKTGQLWGNPIYHWPYHEETGFSWWLRRLKRAGELYDLVRLDHFRGLEQYYAVPTGAETAENGEWRPGPGMALPAAIRAALPSLSIVAENLGHLTPGVHALLRACGWPGMLVMQFAFDGNPENPYLPHRHPENAVVYTGTHDSPPTAEWAAESAERRARVAAYAGEAGDAAELLLRMTLSSVAALAVIPIQDWLGLGAASRLNTPGVAEGNWCWRLPGKLADHALAERMREETRRWGR